MKKQKGITLIALIITIVVLMILAVVTINSVKDGGIITHAQNAATKMNKAQIEEKANLVRLEYTTDCYANKNLKKSIQEFKDKLIGAFEVTADTNNDNIIEVNDKYAVVIKNSNLDIEVVEITNKLKANSLVLITYEMKDAKGEKGEVDNTSIDFAITQTMTEEEYNNLIAGQETSDDYTTEYEISLVVDGKIVFSELIDLAEWDGTLAFNTEEFEIYISKNTVVEVIVKNEKGTVASEKVHIKNIIDDPNILTKEEAESNWTISYSSGEATISKYIGNEESVVIPYMIGNVKVTSIGINAFANCNSLRSVTIPNGITSIGIRAFSNCSNLTSVTIPESVTSIKANAFSGCSSLISITIPKNVTGIGKDAFSECSSLTNIYFEGTIPETNKPWGASEEIIKSK